MLTTVYLARHGEYENKRNIVPYCLPGFPLSQKGAKQAEKIADYLTSKDIKFIYSSPILRCKQTAEIIGERMNVKPHYSRLIIETRTPFQGMNIEEFHSKYGDTFHPFHFKDGGESLEDIFLRSKKLIDKILKTHIGDNILIVTHGDQSMALIYGLVDNDLMKYFKKKRKYIPIGALVKFDFEGDKLKDYKEIYYD